MATSNDFLDYIKDQLSSWDDEVYGKKMFGVLGLYREGLMFGIIAKDTVYLKIDETNKNKYLEAGSTSLKIFKNNSEVPSYYELPVDVLEDAEVFIEWAKESFTIQVKRNRKKK